MNLCFDGSVMSGDVDIMRESICQVSVSQLVLVCNEPQSIAQIYAPCGNKHLMRKRFAVLTNAETAPHDCGWDSAPVICEENDLTV